MPRALQSRIWSEARYHLRRHAFDYPPSASAQPGHSSIVRVSTQQSEVMKHRYLEDFDGTRLEHAFNINVQYYGAVLPVFHRPALPRPCLA